MARQGDLGGAREQIQQALKISPDNSGALSALEMIEVRMKQKQEPPSPQ
jgi:Flp pilus assembly protein TadD